MGDPPSTWEATRALVATEGWGADLLSKQDAGWAMGGRRRSFPRGSSTVTRPSSPGQPWIATTWALRDLREWGLDSAALPDEAAKLEANSRWDYDDLPYWGGEVDVCINSYTLATGAWLGADVSALAAWFPAHRLADGGWNCEAEEGNSTRSSFHSTLNAARGMLAYERITGDTSLRDARHGGEEYLLSRRLLYRATTGELVGEFATRFVYPNRHRYSALFALDHFRDASLLEGCAARPTTRRRGRRRARGAAARRHVAAGQLRSPGRTWFDVDVPEGEPSRWLTLIGTRVLDWWDAAR